MDCPPGQKNAVVVEKWPLLEVRLHSTKNLDRAIFPNLNCLFVGVFEEIHYGFVFLETTSCKRSSKEFKKTLCKLSKLRELNPLKWLHCIRQVILVTLEQLIFFARSSTFKDQTVIIWNSQTGLINSHDQVFTLRSVKLISVVTFLLSTFESTDLHDVP